MKLPPTARGSLPLALAVAGGVLVLGLVVAWRSGSTPQAAANGERVIAASAQGTPTSTTVTTTTLGPSGPPIVVIGPGDNLEAIVAANPPGSTFILEAGIHRGAALEPKDGQVFEGRRGAVMSGAAVLSVFERRDDLWVSTGQRAEGLVHGQCSADHPRCSYPEELFIDDQVLRHVDSVSKVAPGTWHFDRGADAVYLGDDPTGRLVELSIVPHAFRGDADDVTIRHLTIEKYATPAQQGAIDSRRDTDDVVGGSGWLIEGNVVRKNHGVGIAATTRALVQDNEVYENGQLGLAAKGADVSIVGNEVYGNNTAGFSSGWEGGGSKFAFTQGLVVRDNYVHGNHGPGLWTDIDNINTTYENNRVIDNDRMGIFHEISYDATIRGNEVRGNGFGFDAWVWGAGILVSTSVNVDVIDNIVEGNADGIIGVDQDRSDAPASYGPLSLANLTVSGNVVAGNGGWTGVAQDRGSNAVFTSANNRFADNTYRQEGRHFVWLNDPRTYDEWVGFGQS